MTISIRRLNRIETAWLLAGGNDWGDDLHVALHYERMRDADHGFLAKLQTAFQTT